jgi:2-dehydro-3-deoxyphosphogluconate aldolase / (4S)-4-hydroxy-2-oxoglutarate aldolase
MSDLMEALGRTRILPVLTVQRLEDAEPLARALYDGGLSAIEVTLRTPVALAAMALMKAAVPELYVGAGTLRTPADVDACLNVGADFLISPGCGPSLLAAGAKCGVPFLPGIATASEAMTAAEHGLTLMKFFPAEASGGAAFLKSLAAPLPDLKFCPTGGISAEKAADYLALPNVICVGGSWIAPDEAIIGADWPRIRANASRAAMG